MTLGEYNWIQNKKNTFCRNQKPVQIIKGTGVIIKDRFDEGEDSSD